MNKRNIELMAPVAKPAKARLEAQLAKAKDALRRGQYDLAIRLGKALLKEAPQALVVMDLLAQAYIQGQQPREALTILRAMSSLAPTNAQVWLNLGNLQLQLRHPFDAKSSLERALQIDPSLAAARNSLGVLMMNMGQDKQAEQIFHEILQHQPSDYFALRNLGALKAKNQALDDAVLFYERALSIAATGRARYELADVLFKQDPQAHAERIKLLLESALAAEPQSQVVIDLLARVYTAGRETQRAEELFRQGMRLPEVSPALQLHYADFLSAEKRYADADTIYRKIAKLEPKNWIPYANGANNLSKQGDVFAALHLIRTGLSQNVISATPLRLKAGSFLWRTGDFSGAERSFRESLLAFPALPLCYSDLWYFLDANCADENHASAGERIDYGVMMSWRGVFNRIAPSGEPRRSGPLRIGLVSADLRDHVVGHFLRGVLRSMHAQHVQRLTVHAFANHDATDPIARDIQSHCASWHNISKLDDLAAAQRIAQERIDILIDLAGHTSGNRLPLFTYRPAPIQVSWLGYFATTGLFEMDYLLTDPWSLPKGHRQYFSESLWQLPHTRLCYTEPDLPVHDTPLPALQNGYLTFGCFNQSFKLTPDTLNAWAEILRRVPRSRLYLKNSALGSAEYREQLTRHFARFEIDAARLLFEPASSHADYLQCFAKVDIALDPFPYTGGGTTVDNLRSGVPVLTRYGDSLISRQSFGMLMMTGLDEWVAADWAQYIDLAVRWATDLPKLSYLRAELRMRVLQSPLFDADGMAADLADAFEAMWAHWQQGKQPDPLQKFSTALQNRYMQSEISSAPVWIIAATQKTEEQFWESSALGRSLKWLMPLDARLHPHISCTNRRGLPEIYNAAIDAAPSDAVLVFMHDDVWIDHLTGFTKALDEGLQRFQVLGVAGNRRRQAHQPAWGFINRHLHPEEARYLSGGVGHGETPG